MTRLLVVSPEAPEPRAIALAARCLREGGLVAFPTETVYGLGANALDPAAVDRPLRRLLTTRSSPEPSILCIA